MRNKRPSESNKTDEKETLIKKHKIDNSFKPYMNTNDIDNSIKKIELDYKEFAYLGTAPIDFYGMNLPGMDKITRVNISQLVNKGKTKLGMIFNLSPHYEQGSRWVGLYIDLLTGIITYYNVDGKDPPIEIKKYIKLVIRKCFVQYIEPTWNITFSKMKPDRDNYQKYDASYSIEFIKNMLKGIQPEFKCCIDIGSV